MESDMQTALATRINLQIVISQIPAIEEHMDLPLSRWLDSLPLPPEMPPGGKVNLSVWLGSDLSRMGWSAFGPPPGFIPKMAEYLQKCGMSPGDLDLINRMGESIEPDRVGSWVVAAAGAIRTGWHFCEPMPVARVASYLGEGLVMTKFMSWIAKRDIVEYRRFARAVSKDASSMLELVLPGDTTADKVALAAEAFADLGAAPLDPALVPFFAGAEGVDGLDDVSLGIEMDDEKVLSVSLYGAGMPADVVSPMCDAAAVEYNDGVGQIARMLKADGIERVVYERRMDGTVLVDVELVPNQLETAVGPGNN